jgi:hypothetical protein
MTRSDPCVTTPVISGTLHQRGFRLTLGSESCRDHFNGVSDGREAVFRQILDEKPDRKVDLGVGEDLFVSGRIRCRLTRPRRASHSSGAASLDRGG